jgi:hypothetical protein
MDKKQQTIRDLWENTNLSQATIAVMMEVTPDSLSRWIATLYSREERQARISRVQSAAQQVERCAKPSWYTGKGNSCTMLAVRYCKQHKLTCLPPGMTVIENDGELLLTSKSKAKQIKELRMMAEHMRQKDEVST